MKFLIFTKYRCSYCDRAKTLIEQKGFEYESINIEEDNNIEILLKKNKYAAGSKFSIADIEAFTVLTFANWIKINGREKRKNITNWAEKLEKRKAFKDYFNLIS